MSALKTYLGDGVYLDYDGYSVILTTENGISVQNTIVLDPEVVEALINKLKALHSSFSTMFEGDPEVKELPKPPEQDE